VGGAPPRFGTGAARPGGRGVDGRARRSAVGRPERTPPNARRVAADTVQRALARFNGGVSTTPPWDALPAGAALPPPATEPAREARTAPLPDSLHPAVLDALARREIHELYA